MSAVASPTSLLPSRGRPRSRAGRVWSERIVRWVLLACAVFSIVTTFAIIAVLARETFRFFTISDSPNISVWKFITGTDFGVLPLVSGTLLITGIAAIFALPIGLVTAVYLSEYARPRVRSVLKSVLEVLAGVPTVVYGFFALTFITPNLLQPMSEAFGTYNALSAGLAVGFMILPIVCSLSEDALRAVPQSLRDGANALGATKFDVSVKVVVPAALSGVIASFLLAMTRAIGETMIVALAAGGLAQLTLNPAAQVQTMTAYMVQIFLGDAPAGGVEYQSSYAVAFVLFVLTLGMTLTGAWILRRYREAYE
jgi:phosphate transport system permease protein